MADRVYAVPLVLHVKADSEYSARVIAKNVVAGLQARTPEPSPIHDLEVTEERQ